MATIPLPVEFAHLPPADIYGSGELAFRSSTNGGTSSTSSADAWSDALSSLSPIAGSPVATSASNLVVLDGNKGVVLDGFGDPTSYFSNVLISEWFTRFYTFTWFFKMYWDEVVYFQEFTPLLTTTEVSRTSKDWTWTPADFLSAFDYGDPSTWPVTDTFTYDDLAGNEPPDPVVGDYSGKRQFIQIENFRWSFVPGYDPAVGDANGFPVLT